MDFKPLITITLSALPIIFWLWFYFKRLFVPKQVLFSTFLKGLFIFGVVYLVETKLINIFLPNFWNLLLQLRSSPSFHEFFGLHLLIFFIIAPLEEIPKFFVLKRTIFKAKGINQIIDGLQLGIILGLGFAFGENLLKFSRLPSGLGFYNIITIFLLRFFLSTLAHIIYAGVMGYYLAMARFHKFYRPFLLNKALILPILLHGVFNASIAIGAPELSILLLLLLSFLLYKWYHERRLFEMKLQKEEIPISPPFLAETQETDVYFSKEKVPFEFIQKSGLTQKQARKTQKN